jgi:DNA-binding transcriptional LysR family regulator
VVNRSLSKAASEMGRSQSTLSHQIKCLENEFGVVLFDRSRRRMELTSEGKVLFENALVIFDIIGKVKDELRLSEMQMKGTISIATTRGVLRDILPKFLSMFRNKFPQVQFYLDGCDSVSEILQKTVSGQADFGISINKHLSKKVEFIPFFQTGLSFITPQKGPFHFDSVPELEKITEVPFISLPDSSAVMSHVNAFFTLNNLSLNIIHVLNSAELVKKYVEIGFGVAILGSYGLLGEDKKRLTIHQLDQYFPKITYGIIRRTNVHRSPELKAFFGLLLK